MVIEAKSFVNAKIKGTYEKMIENFEQIKHPFKQGRHGYNQAHYSSFHFVAPRIKEECIHEHLAYTRAKVLNPKKLKPEDWGLLMPKWLFKKIYRKNWDSHARISVGGLFEAVRIFMHFFCKLPFIPLKSVNEELIKQKKEKGNTLPYDAEWKYVYCFGYIKDTRRMQSSAPINDTNERGQEEL